MQLKQVFDPVAQNPGLQVAGVDPVPEFGDSAKYLKFARDRLFYSQPLARQRVPAAGLRETAQKGFRTGFEVEQARVDALAAQFGQPFG